LLASADRRDGGGGQGLPARPDHPSAPLSAVLDHYDSLVAEEVDRVLRRPRRDPRRLLLSRRGGTDRGPDPPDPADVGQGARQAGSGAVLAPRHPRETGRGRRSLSGPG